ncbi:RICIN domain-containing protein [Streptomyces yaizuensis]|uniref:RICIN domain-containing protein n=1 Tax=Streptomyces yaizuensis TaxID=2989713 RepID=A0ABQ5NX88_9ACTN|nr:RICIN domain-containing protein [Streptomyces sp. YSPA8]GLF94983.1 RICIN domain-containing protein [Streptomyces sp. YSPA8]
MFRTARTALVATVGVVALIGGTATAGANQSPAPAAADPAATSAAADPSYVQLQVKHSGKCLTVAKGSFKDRTAAVQSACAPETDHQLFRMVPTGPGTFELRPRHSGRCLTTGSGHQWKALQIWCGGVPEQRWSVNLADVATNLYEVRPDVASEYCLTVSGAAVEENTDTYIGLCKGSSASRWQILPAA